MCLLCILLCARGEPAIPCSIEPSLPSTHVCPVLIQHPQASYFVSTWRWLWGSVWSTRNQKSVTLTGRISGYVAHFTVPASWMLCAAPSALCSRALRKLPWLAQLPKTKGKSVFFGEFFSVYPSPQTPCISWFLSILAVFCSSLFSCCFIVSWVKWHQTNFPVEKIVFNFFYILNTQPVLGTK